MKEVVANVYLTKIQASLLRNILTEWCNQNGECPDHVKTIRKKLDLIPVHNTVVNYLKRQIKLGKGACQASVRRVARFALNHNKLMTTTRNLQEAYKIADHYCRLLGGYVWTYALRYAQPRPGVEHARATRIYQFGGCTT